MRHIALSLTVWLAFATAAPASAGPLWEITIDGPVTIRSTGPVPTLTPPGTPPVVTPPVVVPPVVVPPVVVPPVDTSLFIWPSQPPNTFYVEERYTALGPPDAYGTPCCYVSHEKFQNPSPGTHLFAGYPAGPYAGSSYRLWAPVGMAPAAIRRLLATGAP